MSKNPDMENIEHLKTSGLYGGDSSKPCNLIRSFINTCVGLGGQASGHIDQGYPKRFARVVAADADASRAAALAEVAARTGGCANVATPSAAGSGLTLSAWQQSGKSCDFRVFP